MFQQVTLAMAAGATGTTVTGTFVITGYGVDIDTTWVNNGVSITGKTASQYVVTFATPVPTSGSHTMTATAFSSGGTASGASARRTLSDLRTAVRDNLDEAVASFWSDAQLNRFINRAKDRVWTEVRKLKEDYFLLTRSSTDGTVVIFSDVYDTASFQISNAGTLTYTLPPDHAEMKLIEVITPNYEYVTFEYRDMAHPDFKSARKMTSQFTPEIFLFDITGERTLQLAQKSDTALDLRISYIPIVPDMSADTDLLEMPHALYMAVEEFATASALKMDRDPNSAAWEQTGNASIARALGASARQDQDPEFVQAYLSDWTGR
jgi:hypothetical protein